MTLVIETNAGVRGRVQNSADGACPCRVSRMVDAANDIFGVERFEVITKRLYGDEYTVLRVFSEDLCPTAAEAVSVMHTMTGEEFALAFDNGETTTVALSPSIVYRCTNAHWNLF